MEPRAELTGSRDATSGHVSAVQLQESFSPRVKRHQPKFKEWEQFPSEEIFLTGWERCLLPYILTRFDQ